MKRIIKLFFILISFLLAPIPALAEDSSLGIEDRTISYLIGDFESGRIIEQYNIDQALPTASISKLMTYLVVKDEIAAGNISLDDRVTITEEMASVGGSDFRLLEGEVLTIDELLTGIMVVSGNDASYALAVHTAGSEEAFVEMMNAKAEDLGLDQADFYNASGLQSPQGQNTMTSREIFTLARHIIDKYPEVLDYGHINILTMPERNYTGYSTLPLAGEMPGVDGLKTGFTEEAGYCFCATMDAKETPVREDYRLITVVMGTADLQERSDLSRFLLEYAMDNYQMKTVLDERMPFDEIQVNSAKSPAVPVYPSASLEVLAGRNQSFNYQETLRDDIKAPIAAGEKLGELKVLSGGEEVVTVDLVSKYDVEQAGFFTRLIRAVEDTLARLLSFVSF